MALRSATPFHNQWPSVAFALMPNSLGAPIQTADVQVGDICYDDTTQVYYYCQDATLNAAVWLQFSGGPPPPTPDHQFPVIIVGNAPNGDTLDVCDVLDPGDGTGIQSALTSAAYGTIGPFAQDVYVRPGVYGPNTLNIPEGVRLLGAGRGRTILTTVNGVTAVDMLAAGCELADVTVACNQPNLSGVGSASAFVNMNLTNINSNPLLNAPSAIRRVNVDIINYDPQSITSPNLSCVGVEVGGVRPTTTSGHKIHDVRCAYLGTGYATGGSTPFQLFAGFSLTYPGYDPQIPDPAVEIDMRNCTAIDTEVGFRTDAISVHLDRCIYDGQGLQNFVPPGVLCLGFYVQEYANNSTLDACVAKQSIGLSFGFLLNASVGTFSSNIALNSCTAYRAPGTPPLGSAFGFTLDTPNSSIPLRGVRMYGCKAENYNTGFSLAAGAENTTAIGCVSAGNIVALDDNGTGNDFGHLQTI